MYSRKRRMDKKEIRQTTTVEIDKPRYQIGQTIFVPQRDGALETTIEAYWIGATTENEKLRGVIVGYRVKHPLIQVRRGEDAEIPSELLEKDFYDERARAEEASEFLPVVADEETWKRAVGVRRGEDENSSYNIDNSDLPSCCANISEARDILYYCKSQGGLLVHDCSELKRMLEGHGYSGESLSKIMMQLRMEEKFK